MQQVEITQNNIKKGRRGGERLILSVRY